MKNWLFVLVLLALGAAQAQQSSSYFPASSGFKWCYRSTPLDSMQQKVDSLTFYQVDTLAGEGTYLGVSSKYVLSKTGPAPGVLLLPYLDTTFYNFSGTETKEYFRIPNLDSISAMMTRYGLDTLFGAFSLINTFKSFEKWYTMYKFSSSVNASYTIFQYDTTVTIQSASVPLRFLLKGKRLADKQLTTEIGAFTCKVFLMEYSMNYLLVLPPPLPTTAIPLLTIPDSVYMAPAQWIVKRVAPSTTMSLSQLGYGSYTFPGLISEIIPAIPLVGVERGGESGAADFIVLQNYPNPFNPGTTVRYTIAQPGRVQVRVMNQLGEEVAVLADKEEPAGSHELYWNAGTIASGVYFLQVKSGNRAEMKKIVLLK